MYIVEIYLVGGAKMELVVDEEDVKRIEKWFWVKDEKPQMMNSHMTDVTDGFGLDTSQIIAYRIVCE